MCLGWVSLPDRLGRSVQGEAQLLRSEPLDGDLGASLAANCRSALGRGGAYRLSEPGLAFFACPPPVEPLPPSPGRTERLGVLFVFIANTHG